MIFQTNAVLFNNFSVLSKKASVSTKIWNSTTVFLYIYIFMIITISWATNQHIRMISEGSRDTEDWINDAENSSAHHRNKLHFKIYSNRKQLIWNIKMFHNIVLVSIRDCFQNILTDHKLLNGSACHVHLLIYWQEQIKNFYFNVKWVKWMTQKTSTCFRSNIA